MMPSINTTFLEEQVDTVILWKVAQEDTQLIVLLSKTQRPDAPTSQPKILNNKNQLSK